MAESAMKLAGSSTRRDTRDAIMRATYRVVAERGAHRLSMSDIASEAGVSKGLIHYHFDSKLDVIAEALEWAIRATADRIRATMASPDYENDPLSGLVAAIFVEPSANRGFYLAYLDLIEHISREEAFQDFPRVMAEIIEGLYRDVVQAGWSAGRFGRSDIEAAAADIRVVVDGTFVRWMQQPGWKACHADTAQTCRRLLATILQETT